MRGKWAKTDGFIGKGFLTLDGDFDTKHNVLTVYQIGNAYVMYGSADLTKKGAPASTTEHLTPLINVFWLNDRGKIVSWVVTFTPEAKPAGYSNL